MPRAVGLWSVGRMGWQRTGDGLRQLQRSIGYHFGDKALLKAALAHPPPDRSGTAIVHSRLQFLGSSLLGTILAEELHRCHPDRADNDLTSYRTALSTHRFLAALVREYAIDSHISYPGNLGVRDKDSVQSGTLEAIVGAIFLDSKYGRVKNVVLRWYDPLVERLERELRRTNPKGRIQDLFSSLQPHSVLDYRLIAEKEADHERVYSVALYCDEELLGIGSGTSKKIAEKNAAFHALGIILQRTRLPQ